MPTPQEFKVYQNLQEKLAGRVRGQELLELLAYEIQRVLDADRIHAPSARAVRDTYGDTFDDALLWAATPQGSGFWQTWHTLAGIIVGRE